MDKPKNQIRMKKVLLMSFACLFFQVIAFGQQVKPSQLFSDGFVLQQNAKVPIWGTAPSGTKVAVEGSWDHKVVTAITDEKGRWEVLLETPSGGSTPYTVTINDQVIRNVLIGEVWICSGQSNMKFRLGESWNDNWQVKGDNIQTLRLFEVGVVRSRTPLNEVDGFWRYGVFDNNMQHISAVGYYFGRHLQEVLKVPVGLIGIYEGGTAAEEWTRKECFDQCPELEGTYNGAQPVGCLYNGMVAPILPYKNAGIIWYQGENNVGHQHSYKTLIRVMAEGWRDDFKEAALPFYLAQLPTYGNDDWRTFREIQEQIAQELPNSGLAVTLDGGEETEIHSHSKKIVGDRLANIALGRVYGLDYPVSSPVFRKQVIEGNKIRLYFKYVEKGFKLSGNATEPDHFEISGSDGIYYPASARIEGNTILLWNEKVAQPVASRYFWKKYAIPNIYTQDNLPIVPFRTQK